MCNGDICFILLSPVSYTHLLDLKERHEKDKVVPGMEPTGHYWFNLGKFLQDNEMKPVLDVYKRQIKIVLYYCSRKKLIDIFQSI